MEKLHSLIDVEALDFVIMNHAEPDHTNAIKTVMDISSEAKLVTAQKGAKMAQVFYKIPEQRLVIVKNGDTLELGCKTLCFIEAPWLHWPETMFTYVQENLLSAQFGQNIISKRANKIVGGITSPSFKFLQLREYRCLPHPV
jgi:flavorubredoxin